MELSPLPEGNDATWFAVNPVVIFYEKSSTHTLSPSVCVSWCGVALACSKCGSPAYMVLVQHAWQGKEEGDVYFLTKRPSLIN